MSVEIGRKLKQARISKNISLEEMSYTAKIDKKLLIELERGNWRALPGGPTYIRTCLLAYSRLLGINMESLLEKANKSSTTSLYTTVPQQTGASIDLTMPPRSRRRVRSIAIDVGEKMDRREAAVSKSSTVSSRRGELHKETSHSRRNRGSVQQEKDSPPIDHSMSTLPPRGSSRKARKESSSSGSIYNKILMVSTILLLLAGAYVMWLRISTDEVKPGDSLQKSVLEYSLSKRIP